MRISLHLAELAYGEGFVLHTAASGAVPRLVELYLRLDTDEGWGLGEVRINIAYLNRLAAETVIADTLAAIETIDWAAAPEAISTDPAFLARLAPTRTLIDTALIDLRARRAGVSVAGLFGGPMGERAGGPALWQTNQTLFWSDHETFLDRAERYVRRGFRDLKVRLGVGSFAEDLRRVRALRDRWGSAIEIAADVNGAWSEAEAGPRLAALADLGLAYVEQPIPAEDFAALVRIAEASAVPIMLDESVACEADVARIAALGGRLWAHLKLVKLGGPSPTVAAARRLAAHGVPVMIGQMNEGGGATAAALHVACAVAPRFAELYGADGLADDPVSGVVYGEGRVSTGDDLGLGVAFSPSKTQLIREFHA